MFLTCNFCIDFFFSDKIQQRTHFECCKTGRKAVQLWMRAYLNFDQICLIYLIKMRRFRRILLKHLIVKIPLLRTRLANFVIGSTENGTFPNRIHYLFDGKSIQHSSIASPRWSVCVCAIEKCVWNIDTAYVPRLNDIKHSNHFGMA